MQCQDMMEAGGNLLPALTDHQVNLVLKVSQVLKVSLDNKGNLVSKGSLVSLDSLAILMPNLVSLDSPVRLAIPMPNLVSPANQVSPVIPMANPTILTSPTSQPVRREGIPPLWLANPTLTAETL